MSVDEGQEPVEAGRDDEQKGPSRVVLRGVQSVVLDDLSPERRTAVIEAAGGPGVPLITWHAAALRVGQVETAVKAHAGQSGAPGNKPGQYKAVPAASWFVPPTVIEPPLG